MRRAMIPSLSKLCLDTAGPKQKAGSELQPRADAVRLKGNSNFDEWLSTNSGTLQAAITRSLENTLKLPEEFRNLREIAMTRFLKGNHMLRFELGLGLFFPEGRAPEQRWVKEDVERLDLSEWGKLVFVVSHMQVQDESKATRMSRHALVAMRNPDRDNVVTFIDSNGSDFWHPKRLVKLAAAAGQTAEIAQTRGMQMAVEKTDLYQNGQILARQASVLGWCTLWAFMITRLVSVGGATLADVVQLMNMVEGPGLSYALTLVRESTIATYNRCMYWFEQNEDYKVRLGYKMMVDPGSSGSSKVVVDTGRTPEYPSPVHIKDEIVTIGPETNAVHFPVDQQNPCAPETRCVFVGLAFETDSLQIRVAAPYDMNSFKLEKARDLAKAAICKVMPGVEEKLGSGVRDDYKVYARLPPKWMDDCVVYLRERAQDSSFPMCGYGHTSPGWLKQFGSMNSQLNLPTEETGDERCLDSQVAYKFEEMCMQDKDESAITKSLNKTYKSLKKLKQLWNTKSSSGDVEYQCAYGNQFTDRDVLVVLKFGYVTAPKYFEFTKVWDTLRFGFKPIVDDASLKTILCHVVAKGMRMMCPFSKGDVEDQKAWLDQSITMIREGESIRRMCVCVTTYVGKGDKATKIADKYMSLGDGVLPSPYAKAENTEKGRNSRMDLFFGPLSREILGMVQAAARAYPW